MDQTYSCGYMVIDESESISPTDNFGDSNAVAESFQFKPSDFKNGRGCCLKRKKRRERHFA